MYDFGAKDGPTSLIITPFISVSSPFSVSNENKHEGAQEKVEKLHIV